MAATKQGALGSVLDLSVGISPVDSQTGAMTGKRISMKNCDGVLIVIFKAAGIANDDVVGTLYEYTAYTGGTTTALAAIDKYWTKKETALDGDEAWTLVDQTTVASTTETDITSAEAEMIIAIDVKAADLTDGYTHIGMNIADTGAGGTQPIACLYIPYGLKIQRTPANMPSWLNPGTANA
jgi:hypothetical protein